MVTCNITVGIGNPKLLLLVDNYRHHNPYLQKNRFSIILFLYQKQSCMEKSLMFDYAMSYTLAMYQIVTKVFEITSCPLGVTQLLIC